MATVAGWENAIVTAVAEVIAWQPHAGFQRAFLETGADEVLGGGAAGPGKTDCLIAKAAARAEHPSARELFLRTIYRPDLLDVMDRMQALYPLFGATYHAGERRWHFPSGGTVELGYGKRMSELARYLGREYTGVHFDELGLLPEEKPWDLLLSRLRSTDPTIKLGAWASANPGGPGHAWIKRRFIDATAKGTRVVRLGSGWTRAFVPGRATDNPSLPASYWERLNTLPEPLRSWLKDGNWEAGLGLAFEVHESQLLIRRFRIPEHWTRFGSFDWGFAHPFAAGEWAINEDGDLFLVETCWGRRQRPKQIADSILGKLAVDQLSVIYAGHDCFSKYNARHEGNAPTIAEQMGGAGVRLVPANVARVHGWNLFREALALRPPDLPPQLRIMDTPGNRLVLDQIQAAVVNPDRPEDVLKVDADDHGEMGHSGDDGLDMARFAVASRASAGKGRLSRHADMKDPHIRAAIEAAQNKVGRDDWQRPQPEGHPELGGYL